MRVRRFGASDRKRVLALWAEVFDDYAPHNWPEGVIDRKLALQDELFLVAQVDARVVGTAIAGYDGIRGWIYRVAVSPKYRRRGIGRALVVEAETRLRDLGCVKVNLQVRAGDDAPVEFYKQLGFDVEARVSMGKAL